MEKISNAKAWRSLLFIALIITGFTLLGVVAVYLDLRKVQQAATIIFGFLFGIAVSALAVLLPLGKEGGEDE